MTDQTNDEVLRAIAGHRLADQRIHNAFDTIGDLAAAVVAAHPEPETIKPNQIEALMAHFEKVAEASLRQGVTPATGGPLGSRRVAVSNGDVTLINDIPGQPAEREYLHYSARIPGLHRHLPADVDAPERGLALVKEMLGAMGHPARLTAQVSIDGQDDEIKGRWVKITLPCPEDPEETQRHSGAFGHAGEPETQAIARKIALHIKERWRLRARVRREIEAIAEEAREMTAKVDGLTVLKARVASYSNPGENGGYLVDLDVEMLNHGLERSVHLVRWNRKEGEAQEALVRHVREHRRRTAVLVESGMADGVPNLVIAPVLAAAITACAPEHAAGLLAEIESEMKGKHMRPANPRRRGITDVTIRHGRVNGAVNLSKEVRYKRDVVLLKTVTHLPDTFRTGAPGLPLRDLVDHPFLDGLTVGSIGTAVARGSDGKSVRQVQIRPKEKHVPLLPVLEALRAKVAAYEPPAPKRRAKEGSRA